MPRIEKAARTGFCFGVKRAVGAVENVARERGGAETLGAVVHNRQVLQKLAGLGVNVVTDAADIKGGAVVTSSHGVSPEMEDALRTRNIEVISTTCPNVRKAQLAAAKLVEEDFFVIVFGDAAHPEVKGILGWAKGKGLAATDAQVVATVKPLPRKLGILSQTTEVPAHFNKFVKEIIDIGLKKNSEIRIIDTMCHDLRERQAAAIELAKRADLMLVVGGHSSANTNRIAELCAGLTETHLIETAEDIQPAWLLGKEYIGVTSGASTDEQTVNDVVKKLGEMTAP
jgi:4-hydroxy-3-methylbut-2-en-1-yl diphosphate reductase